MKRNIVLLVSAFFLSGCLEPCPHYNRLQVANFYGATVPAKKSYGSVVPYYSEADIKQPYEPIGFMSCEGQVGEEAAILKAMLYRAADMGADGILLNAHGFAQQETATYPQGTAPLTREGVPPGNAQRMDINVRWGWMALIGNSPDKCVFRAQAIRFKKSQ